ncbi:MAG: cation:proton antiporter [Candidatus Micrarchaeota archaeon]|nr:cation:proton antiporter [Candidatus Micrarchaeota archaeon]
MHDGSSAVVQFSFFIIFALLGTLLSMKLRQPYVVGLLLLGMIAGPNALGIISDTGLIATLSDLGAILLLFTVGIEFSIARILKSSFRALFITAFKMSLLFIFGYEAALYFGLDLTSALFVGAMLSITSTALLFKIVEQKNMHKNRVLPLLFSMLIFEDIAAVAALTFFSSLGSGAPTYEDKVYSILVSLGLLGAFYILVRKAAADMITRLTSTFSQEVMIFVSFSLCLALSMVSSFLGLSPAIGAFLAGSIVASLKNSRQIEREIKPLLLTFASLFFLSLGMQISPAVILANFPFAFTITALFVLICFSSVYFFLYTTGASSRTALFGASAMVVLGEFSLLIASLARGEFGSLLISTASFGVVATSILSSFLLDNQERLFGVGQRLMPRMLRRSAHSLSWYFSGLMRDFSPTGSFWKISIVCWQCIRNELGKIALLGIILVFLRFAIRAAGLSPQAAAQLMAALFVLAAVPFLLILRRIIQELHPILDALSKSIVRHRRTAKSRSIILRDMASALILILTSIILPEVISFLRLPPLFLWADELLILLALVFLWDVYRHSRQLSLPPAKRST